MQGSGAVFGRMRDRDAVFGLRAGSLPRDRASFGSPRRLLFHHGRPDSWRLAAVDGRRSLADRGLHCWPILVRIAPRPDDFHHVMRLNEYPTAILTVSRLGRLIRLPHVGLLTGHPSLVMSLPPCCSGLAVGCPPSCVGATVIVSIARQSSSDHRHTRQERRRN
jgi:hypothetical protein